MYPVRRILEAVARIARAMAFGLTLAIAVTSMASAQQPAGASNDDRRLIRQLLQRVEELESQLRALQLKIEADDTKPAATPPAANTAGDALSTGSSQDGSPASYEPTHSGPGMGPPSAEIHWFADAGYRLSNAQDDRSSFALGQVDLFTTSRLSREFSVLGEIVLRANQDNRFAVNVERILLQYSASDYLNVGFGRYHTTVGYYNAQYHHGAWFETAATRPLVFAPRGGLVPIHNVGITAYGRVPSGRLGLRYIAEIGNGQTSSSETAEPTQNVLDENKTKAFNLGIVARPDWASGLEIGLTVYRDKLTPAGLASIGHTILATYIVYKNPSFEWLSEAIVVRDAPNGAARIFHTPGFYVQGARRFDRFWPYFRYQYVNAHQDEPVFSRIGRRHGPSLGLRFEMGEFAAFKLQYDHIAQRRRNAINTLTAQLAFTF